MTADNDHDHDDFEALHPHFPSTIEQQMTLIIERQNNVLRRLRDVEKKQGEVDTMLNKGIGAASVVMGLGVLVGWMFSISSTFVQWFHR